VAESGTGYTLSGKPLDPQSAAARPYLQRGGHAAATTADVVADDAPASAKTDGPRPAPARARVPRERVASLKRPVEDDSEDDDEESGGGGYTLRRKQAPQSAAALQQLADPTYVDATCTLVGVGSCKLMWRWRARAGP
jgi:hypothetical protein